MSIKVSDFCKTSDGSLIKKYTLVNKNGMTAEIINLGGIITALTAPDRNYHYKDIVLGFTKPEYYETENSYFFGAIIGRFANRIANAEFNLEGKKIYVDKNNGQNHIHGGEKGFSTRIWEAELLPKSNTLKLSYFSKDGEQGFPGNLTTNVFYTLTDHDELEIFCEAVTDQTTVINITSHSYFNLSGDFSKPIDDHSLLLKAQQFIPVDAFGIPDENFFNVENTPFDFRELKKVGKDIESDDEQLKIVKGYDHCFVLDGKGFRKAAVLSHSESGRQLEILTDQPGIQLYTGNHLDGKFNVKSGGKNIKRTGICLETQHFPDSPNHISFPSVVLKAGEKWNTKTIYRFSVTE